MNQSESISKKKSRSYRGKLVLVTGASAGLGEQLAKAYHHAGADVALVARRADRLSDLAERLCPQGKSARAFPFDLLQIDEIPNLVRHVIDSFGRPIDVLVHCAASSCYGELERIPFKEMERLFQLNVLSGVRLVQCVVDDMKQKFSGQVVWIGSGSAFRGIPRAAAYSASKAAAKCFCEALRSELAPYGVDVLLVIPGALNTSFHESQPNFSSDSRLRSIGSASDPKRLAEQIVSCGERRKTLLIHGHYAWLGQHLAYWTPSFLDTLFRRQL